ncbi:MAG: nucleotide-binding universal stress UspA family protein [Lentimonas sp.]|jgi:nucleotide-binding universal stress UspA family protein
MKNTKPTILVCLDVKRNSKSALLYACHLAKKSDFIVEILVVTESVKSMLFAAKTVEKNLRREVEKSLKKFTDLVLEHTGTVPVVSIREGDITAEIEKELKATENCIMLVFGKSHSHSGNDVLPKLSSHIGTKVNVPVVIVPDDLSDEYLTKLCK